MCVKPVGFLNVVVTDVESLRVVVVVLVISMCWLT